MSARAIVLFIVLIGAVVGLQALHERGGGPPAATTVNVLYVRSPEAMKRLALSYEALLADVYWIRAVQHYGSTKRSSDPLRQYDLLYPLLDLTTSLDPRFNVAYYFGSIFLAEPPPGGPGRSDLAIALLEKGLRAQPDKWEFAQAIGFVHYWWLRDYDEAAAWFVRAGEFPNAPFWLAPLAAATLAEGGSRQSSRVLWQEFARSVEYEAFRSEAVRRLKQLDAMDQIDRLQQIVKVYTDRHGAPPTDWNEVRRNGYLNGIPLDPAGVPYAIRNGTVVLGRGSPYFPLPVEAAPGP